MMNIKSNAKYALVVPTSMGVRMTPETPVPVYASKSFNLQATSAETNVASISSYLGLPVKVLTAFVKDSPIADFIKADLRSRGMEYEGKEVEQGGPWGYRHQFNIADSGFGLRGPRVCNDRAGEVGQTLSASDFDLDKLFHKDGVAVLHMSGLVAALSPNTSELCRALAREAKKAGTIVSFDLNYRASFWKGREQELHAAFSEIASLSDILIGNEEDFQLCLGIEGPKVGGDSSVVSKTDSFKEMIMRVKKLYPGATAFATTLRSVEDAGSHLWGAIMLVDNEWQVIEPRRIKVLDRIGGGDGFVGGLLYAVIKGMSPREMIEFGWASGALAVTFPTDYAQPCDEEQIRSIISGNARIKR